jgi:hypothetical protein
MYHVDLYAQKFNISWWLFIFAHSVLNQISHYYFIVFIVNKRGCLTTDIFFSVLPDMYFIFLLAYYRRWNNRVDTVCKLWVRRPHVWFPAGLRDFSLLQNFQAVSATHQTSYSNFTAGSFLGCKAVGTWIWLLSCAEVTNQYAFMTCTVTNLP